MARASCTEPWQCGEGIASCWKLDGKQGSKCQEQEESPVTCLSPAPFLCPFPSESRGGKDILHVPV